MGASASETARTGVVDMAIENDLPVLRALAGRQIDIGTTTLVFGQGDQGDVIMISNRALGTLIRLIADTARESPASETAQRFTIKGTLKNAQVRGSVNTPGRTVQEVTIEDGGVVDGGIFTGSLTTERLGNEERPADG